MHHIGQSIEQRLRLPRHRPSGAPYLITLQTLASEIADHLILEVEAGFAQLARDPLDSGSDGTAIDQAADDGHSAFDGLICSCPQYA
jgi:hypothetical protein